MSDTEALLERRYRVLGCHAPLFYDRPVRLVRGQGVWLYDDAGRAYLDVYNNVPCVGHCHPHVTDAIARQAATLNVHSRYLHDLVVSYAERLTATFGDPLNAVMFTCTGTEANELALRLARFHTGGRGVIVSDFSYHGNSELLSALTSCFETPEPFPSFARAVPIPDPARDRQGRSDEELADAYAEHVRAAVNSLQADGVQMAAILIDTFFANEGLPDRVPGYVEKAVEIVRQAGGLFICDEVQSGFARTGAAMWGHRLTSVTPDIVTLGKPMGNGHPLAGVITRRELVDKFGQVANYFNTFGANPVSAAAGLAVLDVIEREQLLLNSKRVGAYVREGLERLKNKHSLIANVRGQGLFFGIELAHSDANATPATAETKRLVNAMRERGILLSRIGRYDNILKMRPPLVFKTEHADQLLSTLDHALSEL
ncbi:aspartate aminotransferase family protein [Steroidobacter sp.]|uniref:aspartate aminotransferase family protein n=1 Tax=Steroidobacter sp. TaxID=1978227 RepID=UPI001A3D4677|nr:aminotransferase class III-fold pyridoxal phosphate-dependent enzyme [Steroidobacter sp.]MBL8268443.1 aminotransferase class III-fold pyridoxal phosphate-dependent enzyme [Steroidobacter sp.]